MISASITETLTFRYPLLLASSSTMGPDLVPSPSTFIRLLVGECLYWLGMAELPCRKRKPAAWIGGTEAEKGKKTRGGGNFYSASVCFSRSAGQCEQ